MTGLRKMSFQYQSLQPWGSSCLIHNARYWPLVLLTYAGLLVKSFLLCTRERVRSLDLAVVDVPELRPSGLNALLEPLRSLPGLPGVIAAAAGTSFPHAPVMSTAIRIENNRSKMNAR